VTKLCSKAIGKSFGNTTCVYCEKPCFQPLHGRAYHPNESKIATKPDSRFWLTPQFAIKNRIYKDKDE